jgi:hypothetical protein
VNLAQIINVVTNVDTSVILGYFEETNNDIDLKNHIIEQIKKSKFKKYADLNIRFARRLGWYAFVRILKPQVIIETGVDKGLGSVLLWPPY